MFFDGRPPKIKCEWIRLRAFVDQFNKFYGKSYERSRCLDLEGYGPQPEFLLEADGELGVVIERKCVIWPAGSARDYAMEDLFFETLQTNLSGDFRDDLYRLSFASANLKSKAEKDVVRMAEELAGNVRVESDRAATGIIIRGLSPFAWSLCRVSHDERDDGRERTGVTCRIVGEFTSDVPSQSEIAEITVGLTKTLEQRAADAVPKFRSYPDCVKLLVVEFYADGSFIPDEDVLSIARSADIPRVIDQVWVAEPRWISDEEYEVFWHLVQEPAKSNCSVSFAGYQTGQIESEGRSK